MSICYTGNYTPVIQIYDCTVITYIMVLQKQIGEIRTPFLIWSFSSKILLDFVFKNTVRLAMCIVWLFGTDDRAQPHFRIHIFMNRCRTVNVSSAYKINGHAPITVHTLMCVVNVPDLCLYL